MGGRTRGPARRAFPVCCPLGCPLGPGGIGPGAPAGGVGKVQAAVPGREGIAPEQVPLPGTVALAKLEMRPRVRDRARQMHGADRHGRQVGAVRRPGQACILCPPCNPEDIRPGNGRPARRCRHPGGAPAPAGPARPGPDAGAGRRTVGEGLQPRDAARERDCAGAGLHPCVRLDLHASSARRCTRCASVVTNVPPRKDSLHPAGALADAPRARLRDARRLARPLPLR